MKVKDFMIRDVITVKKDDNIKHLLNTLVKYKIGGVPVIDSDGKLVGMISDGDVLRSINPKDKVVYDFYNLMTYTLEKGKLEDILSRIKDQPLIKLAKKQGLITVKENDEIETVLKLLAKHHFKKIPVINDEHKVVGVISRGDVIRTIQKNILQSL
ncbi:CBS domain-containing protein [Heyndrickxia camelliae]|uniref:CBS domain-containing protein n=1 Tax=Heyndrickxia camelliae TaxID=1707093 RepID=A0A2N3LIV4_9BACI|nr:CBS domain-containing protein [Heyndrickxia camelliae]PKR84463.1 CBS domain-containing protein [Heyndrickxia camelliae]